MVETWRQRMMFLVKVSARLCGLPGWLSGEASSCQCRRFRFNRWIGKVPRRRAWQPTPVFLTGESHEQRSLAGYSPQGCKELDMTERRTVSLNAVNLFCFLHIRMDYIKLLSNFTSNILLLIAVFKNNFIGVQLLYNVVLVSTLQ